MQRLFCFQFEDLHEACEEMFGFGKAKVIGTDDTYLSIWVHINLNEEVKVEFYKTEKELNLGEPAFTKTLSECYLEMKKNKG